MHACSQSVPELDSSPDPSTSTAESGEGGDVGLASCESPGSSTSPCVK